MNQLEAEIAISALHSSGDYVVLRRLCLENAPRFSRQSVAGSKVAICIDTETTGMDYVADKIIEIGIVAFEYDPTTGSIIRVSDHYNEFEDPSRPLTFEIMDITGITDEMLAG